MIRSLANPVASLSNDGHIVRTMSSPTNLGPSDPATGAVLATATHADGSKLTQTEMGPTCFVDSRLVMASSYGIRTFDTIPTP